MKNLFLSLAFMLIGSVAFANNVSISEIKVYKLKISNFENLFLVNSNNEVLRKKKIDETIISDSGCKIHIVGEVSYTIIPPAVTGFEGTITISGGKDCPKGSMTFSRTSESNNVKADLLLKLDSDNLEELSKVSFENNKLDDNFTKVLNTDLVSNQLVKIIKTNFE